MTGSLSVMEHSLQTRGELDQQGERDEQLAQGCGVGIVLMPGLVALARTRLVGDSPLSVIEFVLRVLRTRMIRLCTYCVALRRGACKLLCQFQSSSTAISHYIVLGHTSTSK
jgi:hypothetical protein